MKRFPLVVALLRSVIGITFSLCFFVFPEQMMPGSSTEPARTLALFFASRTLLVGLGFTVLVVRRERRMLRWLFIADVGLQLFDAALSLPDPSAAVPVLIGVFEVLAARQLRD